MRKAVALIAREINEAEISGEIGAELGESADEIGLPVARERSGRAQFASFLEPGRRSNQAILAVALGAYFNGVSTGKVNRLAEQLGINVFALAQGAWP